MPKTGDIISQTYRTTLLLLVVLLAPLSCSLVVNRRTECDPNDDRCPPGSRCGGDRVCVAAGSPEDWILVHAGTFTMGSPPGEAGRDDDETQHEVTLTRDFEIQATEVTQAQFQELMDDNPSGFGDCPNCPVETVSWHEAAAYCNALSDLAGLDRCYECSGSGTGSECDLSSAYATPYDCPGYRLPTEAEWEYAARGGITQDPRATFNGEPGTETEPWNCSSTKVLEPIAWYCNNGRGRTHPVGGKSPHRGLYDMLGNVEEWV